MRLWLPPYISVRQAGDRLRLGTLPPLAHEVADPPAFLAALLGELAQPLERDEIVAAVADRSGWSDEEAALLVADLEAVGVLAPAFDRGDRYDRHRLYYRLLGLDGDPQARLATVTVGLIGMGGIGTHLAVHLAAAGIGRLVITDGDRVELSNLTRQTLYREADVGRLKVEAAAERLTGLRSDLDISVIPKRFDTPALAEAVAKQADLVLLSADRPSSVHSWTNGACLATGRPFSTAGYIEAHGCVGPLLHPPATPCYKCIRVAAEALPGQPLDPDAVHGSRVELNPGFQAPSFGPLNGLVAAVQATEAIRWLLGAPVATLGRRLLLDSATYELTWEDFELTGRCSACGRHAEPNQVWDQIASQYQDERDSHSFNSVLLDDLVPTLLTDIAGRVVADIGAGAGQMTRRLLDLGATVDAYEPSAAMRALLSERISGIRSDRVRILESGLDAIAEQPAGYNAIVCLNVLDHIQDLAGAMRMLTTALRPGGTLVLSLPHPVKDRGGWKKTPLANAWEYEHFILGDYFDEGLCRKVREDRAGNVRVPEVHSYHRTISTYLSAALAAGLRITRVLEPAPDPRVADRDPIVYSKASRLPYFLVITATRETVHA